MEAKFPAARTDGEYRATLTEEAYRVLREAGTEAPFSGKYDQHFEPGRYRCGACGSQLFESGKKYDAGCGWPSFDEAIPGAVELSPETHPLRGTEVHCARCGSHLGHVFPDGPRETTGERYCINSVALQFDPAEALEVYRRSHPET